MPESGGGGRESESVEGFFAVWLTLFTQLRKISRFQERLWIML